MRSASEKPTAVVWPEGFAHARIGDLISEFFDHFKTMGRFQAFSATAVYGCGCFGGTCFIHVMQTVLIHLVWSLLSILSLYLAQSKRILSPASVLENRRITRASFSISELLKGRPSNAVG